MSMRELSSEEIALLAGARHAGTGIEYPVSGLQPYYQWLVRTLHLLAEASAGALRVAPAAGSATDIAVAPGRAAINGVALDYAGGTHQLGTFNNSTALVWLADDGGAAVGLGDAAGGWPAAPHLKLAEVTLEAGQITAVVDRRFDTLLAVHRAAADADGTPLADDSGGTSNGDTVPLVADFAGAADAIATLTAKLNSLNDQLNTLRTKLRDAGLMIAS